MKLFLKRFLPTFFVIFFACLWILLPEQPYVGTIFLMSGFGLLGGMLTGNPFDLEKIEELQEKDEMRPVPGTIFVMAEDYRHFQYFTSKRICYLSGFQDIAGKVKPGDIFLVVGMGLARTRPEVVSELMGYAMAHGASVWWPDSN